MIVTNEAENCFIAVNPGMCRVREQIGQLAKVNIPVLILGESGTGKEVVAKQIHNQSPRAHRTFLKVNCAALPADLLESELFGYEAGAFTGAHRARAGKFELADKGTIFLDEFAEMPPHLQAKLLHVLQDGEFMRLGGQQRVRVDVRVLAATNVNVHQAMENKTLREDLYYRLGGFVINLPPLRQRREDIPALLQYCVTRFAATYNLPPARLTPEFLEACLNFDWPGNVRQLENIAKRLVVLGQDESGLDCMTGPAYASGPVRPPVTQIYEDDLKQKVRSLKEEAEIEAIRRVLNETRWNRKEAAKQLKISYKALLYKVRRYGLDRPRTRTVVTVPSPSVAQPVHRGLRQVVGG